MYFKERLVSVLFFIIINALFCFILLRTKRNTKKILIIYAATLAILAFLYIPYKTADLSRYVAEMQIYRGMSFSDFLNYSSESKIISSKIILFVMSKPGHDGILPMFVAALYFGLFFSILYDMKKRFSIDNKYLVASIILFMATGLFATTINAFRNYLGIMLVAYCYYKETIGDSKILMHIPIYLFSALMHPAVFMLIIIRLVLELFKKEKSIYRKVFKIATISALFTAGLLYYSDIFTLALQKAQIYITGDQYSYIWEYIIYILFYLFILYSIAIHKKGIEDRSIKNLTNSILIYMTLLATTAFEFSIFTRYSSFSIILYAPLQMYFHNQDKIKKRDRKVYYFIYIAITAIILTISATRGNLCSYKIFISEN